MSLDISFKCYRIEAGLSLQQLADLTKLSKPYVWQLEKNRAKPSLEVARKISKVLGVSIAEAFPDTSIEREHHLKIDESLWPDLVANKKTAEVRFNDRNYKVGDYLKIEPVDACGQVLQNFGTPAIRIITHIVEGGKYGLEKGYCLLSMKTVNAMNNSQKLGNNKQAN